MILDRTKEEITEIIRSLERLRIRLGEVRAAATLHPTSQDIGRLETALSKRWNQLVSELSADLPQESSTSTNHARFWKRNRRN